MPAYTEQQRAYWMSAFACGPPVGPYTFTVEAGGSGNFWSAARGADRRLSHQWERVAPGRYRLVAALAEVGHAVQAEPERNRLARQTSSRPTPELRFCMSTPHGRRDFSRIR